MRVLFGTKAVRVCLVGAGLAGCLWLAACDGGAGTTAPQTPAGPPPIAVVVSFGTESAEVFEGDTVEIPVRYESRSLGSPWRLLIAAVPDTAEAADFSIPENFVDIPAGSGTTGEVVFRLVGLPDANFDEGSETLTLRFVPDPAVNAQIGEELPVVIQEGGALVSFVEEEVAVTEGATVDVSIHYEVRNLTAPVALSVSPILMTLAENDFLLEDAAFEIRRIRTLRRTALRRPAARRWRGPARGASPVLRRRAPGSPPPARRLRGWATERRRSRRPGRPSRPGLRTAPGAVEKRWGDGRSGASPDDRARPVGLREGGERRAEWIEPRRSLRQWARPAHLPGRVDRTAVSREPGRREGPLASGRCRSSFPVGEGRNHIFHLVVQM